MNENPKINLQDDMMSALTKMSEGNPGAISVMMQMFKKDPMALIILCHLDDMKIYGSNIWICYKDQCNEDIDLFIEKAKSRELSADLLADI